MAPERIIDRIADGAPEHVSNVELFMLLMQQSNDLDEMKRHIERIDTNTSGMVKAWNAGGVLLDLAKWVTGIAVGLAAAYAAMRGLFDFMGGSK